jgi:hypothetical protein
MNLKRKYMLQNFEDYTHPLTDEEKKLVPLFVEGFTKLKPGQTVTSTKLINHFAAKYKVQLHGSRIRAIINYIRTEGKIHGLLAGQKGYYISQDAIEINNYILSLQGRRNEIDKLIKGFRDHLAQLTFPH